MLCAGCLHVALHIAELRTHMPNQRMPASRLSGGEVCTGGQRTTLIVLTKAHTLQDSKQADLLS